MWNLLKRKAEFTIQMWNLCLMLTEKCVIQKWVLTCYCEILYSKERLRVLSLESLYLMCFLSLVSSNTLSRTTTCI